MKYATLKILAIISAIVIISPARADSQESSDTYFDQAKVLSSVPVYRTVRVSTPRRECRQVPVAYQGHGGNSYKSATPMVLGSIVGAAIGNRFGQGTGKTVGTIAGGILGGSVARDAQYRYGNRTHGYSNGHASARSTTRCDTYQDYRNEERIDGYSVKYRYNGRVYQTRTDNDPGKTMQVKVSVVPAGY